MSELNKYFIKWACSLSGCNGGDPKADIWISGIEPGLDKGSQEDYYCKDLPKKIKETDQNISIKYEWDQHIKYTYGQRLAKLYHSIKYPSKDIKDYKKNITDSSQFNPLFNANLYPIAFNSVDPKLWKEYNLKKLTGFEDKHLFKIWCFLNRFPTISKIVKRESPKLIIGTGVTYLTDFFSCYSSGIEMNNAIQSAQICEKDPKKRKYYWSKLNNGTTIVVIPFLSGPSGLNSDVLLQKMGGTLRKLVPDLF